MSNRQNTCKCSNRVPRCPCQNPSRPCNCPPRRQFRCPCPPELGGIQAQLRSARNVYLNDQESVVFDIISRRTIRDITYHRDTGKFCLRERGNYLINWDVAVEGSYHRPFVRFSLLADNIVTDSSTLPVTVGQISGTSLLTVKNAPIELSLINDTDDIVQLSGFTPVANITITKISSDCL